MADSLHLYDTLKPVFEEPQARAVTQAIQQSSSDLASDFRSMFEELKAHMERRYVSKEEFRAGLAEAKAEMIRWMFVFWMGQVAVTVGTVLAAFRMLK